MSLLPTQTQSMLLYGNGAVIGDTTLVLSSFKDIDGNLLTMQGTVMTGTVEPNSGVQEEQIIFTGVTQNSNGTATLTGISSVGFASPYTQTSGFKKSHAGNTTFVLSDTAYLYSQYAGLGNTQTFTGTDTFSISPFIPTVSSSATTQAASVGYVNSVAISGAAKASNTVIGITELSTAPVLASVPIAVGDNDTRVPTASQALALAGDNGTPSNLNPYVTASGLQNGSEFYALTAGSSTTFTIALGNPAPTGYVTGELIKFKTHVASGTAPTINKNSLGAKSLYKQSSSGTTALAIGDLGTNQMNVAEYDGGAYQLISPTAATPITTFKNGTTTHDISVTGAQNIAHGLGIIPKQIRVRVMYSPGASTGYFSDGVYNGTTTSCLYQLVAGSGNTVSVDTTNMVNLPIPSNAVLATVTFDATNITLTWSKTNTPTGTANIIWEAVA